MSPARLPAIIATVACLTTASARGAEPSGADRALATELFERGRALMAEGRHAEACRTLEESQRLDPGLGTLLNLAICHETMGKTATAWAELHEALALAERSGHADRVELAERHIAGLGPRLSRLTIQVPAAPHTEGLVVERDRTAVAEPAWGVAMPIDPGAHEVVARAPGRRAWRRTVIVGDHADQEVLVIPALERSDLPTPPRTTPSTSAPDAGSVRAAEPSSPLPITGLVVGGIGVALLGVGTYAGLVTLDKDRESDALCSPRCTSRGLELNEEARTSADIATVAFAAGAVAVGVGVYLILTHSPEEARRAARGQPMLRF